MPTFIKAGYWDKLKHGFKGYLNLDDLIRSIAGQSSATLVTYSELINLVTNNRLVPETVYQLTDFQTTHYLCDNNGVILDPNTSEPVINTGAIENLLLKANSTNTFYPEVYSVNYPEDVISYDWNPNNWLQDRGFSSDQINIIPNFKGVIYKRYDTVHENIIGYDFRAVKFRRWKKNYPIYDSQIIYAKGEKVQVPADGCYASLVIDNVNNPVSDLNFWTKIISYDKSEYWEYDSGLALDLLDYQDYLTFVEFGIPYERAVKNTKFTPFRDTFDQFWGKIGGILSNNVFFLSSDNNFSVFNNSFGAFCEVNTFEGYINHNTIGNYFNSNTIGNNFNSNTIGNYFNYNTIGNNFSSNTIGTNFSSNTIGNYFSNNTIGNYFSNNTIGNGFFSNTIGNNFSNNTIGNNFSNNTIGNNFSNNTIGNNFYNNIIGNVFITNTIGNEFYSNTIGNEFSSNTIGNYFNTNTIGNGFFSNTIGNNFYNNTCHDGINTILDFTLATHVYNPYTCELFRRVDNIVRLRYTDALDVIQIVDPVS